MELDKNQLEVAGCLRRLLKSRFLLRSRNEKWFQIVIDLREQLEKVFKPMAVTLEINEPLGVAYLRPESPDVEESLGFQLGRKKTLGPLASALMIKLRHTRLQFFLNPASVEVPLISLEEMREFLQNFNLSKIDSQFERAFRKAIDELGEVQIIVETKSDSGLFEITPLCEILFPLDEIRLLQTKMETYFAKFKSDVENIQEQPC